MPIQEVSTADLEAALASGANVIDVRETDEYVSGHVPGAVNIPIVKFSVDWWSTLHQGSSVFRADGPKMAPEFLYPLLVMGLAYMAVFFWMWFIELLFIDLMI